MKKYISVLLSLVMVLSVFSSAAFATDSDFVGEELSPTYVAGDVFTSTLTFSGKTAECLSSLTVDDNEKWISISQTLEREVSANNWQAVKDGGWTITNTSGECYHIYKNYKTVSENGKYRLKTVFLVESVSGVKQRVLKYSLNVSI